MWTQLVQRAASLVSRFFGRGWCCTRALLMKTTQYRYLLKNGILPHTARGHGGTITPHSLFCPFLLREHSLNIYHTAASSEQAREFINRNRKLVNKSKKIATKAYYLRHRSRTANIFWRCLPEDTQTSVIKRIEYRETRRQRRTLFLKSGRPAGGGEGSWAGRGRGTKSVSK